MPIRRGDGDGGIGPVVDHVTRTLIGAGLQEVKTQPALVGVQHIPRINSHRTERMRIILTITSMTDLERTINSEYSVLF